MMTLYLIVMYYFAASYGFVQGHYLSDSYHLSLSTTILLRM
jgi:hypothetical protein